MIKFEIGEIYEFKGFARALNFGKDRLWVYKNTLIFIVDINNIKTSSDQIIKCLLMAHNKIYEMYVIRENDERWEKLT